MKNRISQKISRGVRWLKYRLKPRALILMYHRVTELPNDPNLLAVTPENFAGHLAEIRKQCSPLSLGQLNEALSRGEVPNRALAVTFDDGYTDNLEKAKPLLEQYQIPGIVFVTAGQIGQDQEFWWDELDRLLLQPGKLPDHLTMVVGQKNIDFSLSGAAHNREEDYRAHLAWHIERPDDPTPRHRPFRQLYEILHSYPEGDRRKILHELADWAGAGRNARSSHLVMDAAQLRSLVDGGLVEAGAHTLTHHDLAVLTPDEQQKEILGSKICLEEILKQPVLSFAYPYGSNSSNTVSLLKKSGLLCACTSLPDAVWAGADPFQLPRVGVRNWDRETFARWLRWWIDG